MCPNCQKNTITRFGPYHPSYILRWHFACQKLDGGCGWWSESNDPFAFKFFRAIGLEGKVYERKEDPDDKTTLKDRQNEWRSRAGLTPKA